MSKPIPRRAFLKALGVGPVAAKSGALRALLDKVEAAAALQPAQAMVGPLPGGGFHLFGHRAIYLAYKAGMLPDWVRDQIGEHINERASYRIDPNVASLRSVSLTNKYRIQRERMAEQLWSQVDRMHAHQTAAAAFWQSLQQEGIIR